MDNEIINYDIIEETKETKNESTEEYIDNTNDIIMDTIKIDNDNDNDNDNDKFDDIRADDESSLKEFDNILSIDDGDRISAGYNTTGLIKKKSIPKACNKLLISPHEDIKQIVLNSLITSKNEPPLYMDTSNNMCGDDRYRRIINKNNKSISLISDLAERLMTENYPKKYNNYRNQHSRVASSPNESDLDLIQRQSLAIAENLSLIEIFCKFAFKMRHEKRDRILGIF